MSGTILKPQISIIPGLDRPCNNPYKEDTSISLVLPLVSRDLD